MTHFTKNFEAFMYVEGHLVNHIIFPCCLMEKAPDFRARICKSFWSPEIY